MFCKVRRVAEANLRGRVKAGVALHEVQTAGREAPAGVEHCLMLDPAIFREVHRGRGLGLGLVHAVAVFHPTGWK